MGVFYCTREAVKAALDIKETARSDGRIDACIDAASRTVEATLHRRFYPQTDTRSFDWPNRNYTPSYRLWLGINELISVTTLVSGGTTIAPTDYLLRRADDLNEPPYDHLEIDLSSSASFSSGGTHQQSIVVTGLFGYSDNQVAAGTLAEALDSSETAVDVSDSSVIGVGHILKVGSERMIVTGRQMLTTGQTLQTPMTDKVDSVTVAVTTGSAFHIGEVILLDSERMLIVDIAGNNLTVKRSWDGSKLATHTGSTVYASRTLTVQRGALGSTAAAHDTAAVVTRWEVPGLVQELALAYALNDLLQGQSGYAREVGSGDNQREAGGRGIAAITRDAFRAYGRVRVGAV